MRKICFTCIMMVAVLFFICLPVRAAGEMYYSVKPGDTLYGIGEKFGISYRSIMRANNLDSDVIVTGITLNIPNDKVEIHTVKYGETLYGLAQKYSTRIEKIKTASNLSSNKLMPGMKLIIPNDDNRSNNSKAKPVFGGKLTFSKDDIYLLAKLIHAEARGESLRGQIAVGAVIINRLVSESFPRTIKEIIFQQTNGVYQFTPVQDGQINLKPDKNAFYAAEQAIRGEDPTNGALFFYNPETSSDQWIRTLAVKRTIGNHVFAK